MYSGGDDKSIKVWNIETCKMVDELVAHENGVTCLAFANGDLYSGSYDHYIFAWDLVEIEKRIIEWDMMVYEDIRSRKLEVFERTLYGKKKKKKKKGKKGAAKKGKK